MSGVGSLSAIMSFPSFGAVNKVTHPRLSKKLLVNEPLNRAKEYILFEVSIVTTS